MPPPTSGARVSINTHSVIIMGWNDSTDRVPGDVTPADSHARCMSNWNDLACLFTELKKWWNPCLCAELEYPTVFIMLCCNADTDETLAPLMGQCFVLFLANPGQKVLRGVLLHRTPQRDISDFSRGTVSIRTGATRGLFSFYDPFPKSDLKAVSPVFMT